MSAVSIFKKDPDETLDFSVDWSDWLNPDSDTIVSSSWAHSDAGITTACTSNSASAATIWLSGGGAGSSYSCTNTIVTACGRIAQRTIQVMVEER